jgi:signal peptidase I
MMAALKSELPKSAAPPWWQRILIGSHPKRTLVRLVILVLFSVVVFKWVLIPVRIIGISMEPTYRNGKINCINRWSFLWRAPQRGDVVGIRLAGENVMLLKRIIALPGERIAVRDGIILVNGVQLEESYVRRPRFPSDEEERLLKADEYYVIGDNREMPLESHTHGIYPTRRLVGRVLF